MILEAVFEGPGTAASNQYLLEIVLILFGAFLLGYLFRHLLNDRYKREMKRLQNELILTQANDQTAELKEQHQIALQQKEERIDQLNTSLSNAISDKVRLQDQVNRLEQKLATAPAQPMPSQIQESAPEPVPEKNQTDVVTPVEKPVGAQDQLTEIEGIGPKMAEVLKQLGYSSFARLSESAAEDIRMALKEMNPTFAVHDPTTWPEQAKLALNGEWDRLKAWQKELKGGRRRKS